MREAELARARARLRRGVRIAGGRTAVRALVAGPLAAALAAGAFGCGPGPPDELPRPGRIVLVSLDTVRADRMSGYGPSDATPTFREIAEGGIRFDRFYAASTFTIPATMSMLTGLDPEAHGVHEEFARLAPEVRTLAQRLAAGSYRTRAFTEGVYVAKRFGFARGFEAYEELGRRALVGEALPDLTAWMREHAGEPYFLFVQTYAAHFPYGGYETLREAWPLRRPRTDAEIEALRREYPNEIRPSAKARNAPAEIRTFCTLYNHLVMQREDMLGCGGNWFPAGFHRDRRFPRIQRALYTAYDARLTDVDRLLAALRDTLFELGQWDDTLFIVTSDHGEAFFEHGLQRHDYVPFDEVLRVPLAISFPARLAETGPRVETGVAWHLDLMPTILGLAGLESGGLPGRDLTGVLTGGESIPADRTVHPVVIRPPHREQSPNRRVSVRGSWKYIEGHERFGDTGADGYLFDLAQDPGERRNLRRAEPQRFGELAEAARAYAAGLARRRPTTQGPRARQSARAIFGPAKRAAAPATESAETASGPAATDDLHSLSPDEIDQLRELGYLDNGAD